MEPRTWKLEELADEAGVSPRTVRYYVQRGLLPAPVFRGRDTAYSAEHLVRLRAIRRLQEQFLPLDAIQVELERRTTHELQRIADGKESAPKVTYHVPAAPSPEPAPMHEERWIRIVLDDGLELHLSDRAPPHARALFDELRARCRGHRKGGK